PPLELEREERLEFVALFLRHRLVGLGGVGIDVKRDGNRRHGSSLLAQSRPGLRGSALQALAILSCAHWPAHPARLIRRSGSDHQPRDRHPGLAPSPACNRDFHRSSCRSTSAGAVEPYERNALIAFSTPSTPRTSGPSPASASASSASESS